MNDLRTEDAEQLPPYAGLATEPAIFVSNDVAALQKIILWLSKRPWPLDHDATWDDLIKQYEKDTSPEPLPALPNGGYRVGR